MKKLHTFLKIIVFFITIHHCYAQNISGELLDLNSKQPLENVSIYLTKNVEIGTFTDVDGKFSLNLKTSSESDSITFSLIGYKKHTTSLLSLKDKNNIIFLTKITDSLNEVTVKTKRKQGFIKYKKVTSLNSRVFSFGSIIIDDKLYITGGDQSVEDETLKIASRRANDLDYSPSFSLVQQYWQPSFTKKSYSDVFLVFDLEKETWEKVDIKIQKRAYHQLNYYDGKLYILGGKKISGIKKDEYLENTIEVVNLQNKNVLIDKTNPHKAVDFASFVYKGNIITMGGSVAIKNGEKVFSDKIHQYNLKTGYWFEIDKMKTGKEVSGILVGNTYYTIGGFNNKPIKTIESWDLITGEWKVEGELFSELSKPALTFNENIIYIYNEGQIISYNLTKKMLRKYAINLNLKNSKLHFYNNHLYIIGGYTETEFSKEPSSIIYKIDIAEFNKTKIREVKNF